MEKSYRLLNLWKPFNRCYGNDSVIKVLGCNVASSRGLRCSHSSATTSKNIRAQFGGRHTVSLLTGDGVGPELLSHVQQVFRYAGAPIDFEEVEISSQKNEPSVMKNALLSVARNGVAIKGNIDTHHDVPTFKSMNLELRLQLDLFANVVHCKTIPSVNVRHKNIDIVLIRENVEGEYSQLAHENVPGVVESLKIITEEKSTRIAKYAFDYALKHGRKQVTAVHKANIMKLGDGLFLECCRKVAALYPGIKFNDMIVDNCSMQMVSRPGQFDVMVLPNLYGNILVNIAAGLIGGAGVVAGANFGENYAVFEAGTRQSGRSMKGKNIANPTGILMASCDLLDYLGHHQHAEIIRDSVMSVLTVQQVCTPDLGGQSTTTDVIQAIIDDIKPKTATRLH